MTGRQMLPPYVRCSGQWTTASWFTQRGDGAHAMVVLVHLELGKVVEVPLDQAPLALQIRHFLSREACGLFIILGMKSRLPSIRWQHPKRGNAAICERYLGLRR